MINDHAEGKIKLLHTLVSRVVLLTSSLCFPNVRFFFLVSSCITKRPPVLPYGRYNKINEDYAKFSLGRLQHFDSSVHLVVRFSFITRNCNRKLNNIVTFYCGPLPLFFPVDSTDFLHYSWWHALICWVLITVDITVKPKHDSYCFYDYLKQGYAWFNTLKSKYVIQVGHFNLLLNFYNRDLSSVWHKS